MAFEKPEIIKKKIDFLYTCEDYFIVHWNKRSSSREYKELKQYYKDKKNVYIYRRYRVYWSHVSILNVMISNMRLALKKCAHFEHLFSLSQQCCPIKSKEYIKDYLSKYQGKSFLFTIKEYPHQNIDAPGDKGINKPCTYSNRFYFVWNHRVRPGLKKSEWLGPEVLSCLWQMVKDFFVYFKEFRPVLREYILLAKKEIPSPLRPFSRFFKLIILCVTQRGDHFPFSSFQVFTKTFTPEFSYLMTKAAGPMLCCTARHISYMLSCPLFKKLKRHIRWCFGPEEFFFQTLLLHSPYYSQCHQASVCITNYKLAENFSKQQHQALVDARKFSQMEYRHPHIDPTFEDALFCRKIDDLQLIDYLYQEIEKRGL